MRNKNNLQGFKYWIEFINKNRWAMIILTLWLILIIYFYQGGDVEKLIDFYVSKK